MTSPRTFETTPEPRLLVAIASFGEKNLTFLRELVERYRRMSISVDVVVLSDALKELGPGVEVIVGLPSKDPWSLPFAHKSVFAQRLQSYDVFLYSEDDIGVTEAHIRAFLEVTPQLADDEIAGFLRYEVDQTGERFMLDVHGRFHWKPESGHRRGECIVAEYTNEHAALYLLTQRQLLRAIESGGYLRPPCEGRHDMLCTAATDPYTVCGFRKVIVISRIDDFLVHHMSNRYEGKWGIRLSEFREQISAQISVVEGRHPASSLSCPETRLLHGEWSKSYYESPLDPFLELVPAEGKSILSIGCGWGETEARLLERGAAVTAVPLDSVIGAAAERRGLNVVYGSLEECIENLRSTVFDTLIMTNLLHLFPDPERVVLLCSRLIGDGGTIVISGPNFRSLRVLAKQALDRSGYRQLRSFESSGIRTVGPRHLRKYFKVAGLDMAVVRWLDSPASSFEGKLGALGARQWVVRADRPAVSSKTSF